MTIETESKLLESVELGIEFVSKTIDEVRNYINKVRLLSDFMTENNFSTDKIFENLESLLEYRMLIGLIYLDLGSATRAHLKSKYTYEKLFSLRQIIVIINEGYKQIYNFVNLNEKGYVITKHRNKSFWYNDIGVIINESIPELKSEYDLLTKKLDDYFDENFDSIKEQRDLSVHYDKDASKVYDMMLGLDVDGTFKKLSPFFEILNEMFRFTENMASILQIRERQKNVERQNRFEAMFVDIESKLDISRTDNDADSIDKLKEIISKIKTDYLDIIKSPNT